MKREWLAFVALAAAAQLAAACGATPETVASASMQGADATGGVGGSAVAVSGRGALMMGPSNSAGVGATRAGAGNAAVGAAAGSTALPPPARPAASGSAGGPAAMSGSPGSTGSAGSAGSGGPSVPAMRSAGCSKPNMMTGLYQGMIRAFDLDRGYYASVPKDYDPERAYRLVFGFHGSGYTGKMMRQYLDNEKAPLLDGTIFIYPDGLPLSDDDPSNTAWELKANGRDSAFFNSLLDQIRNTYCIDETRIFVNGQSFGALMTNFVGCLRGDMIRAIAVVAGSGPYGSMCTGKVAVWITHGMDDDSVPFKSGEMSRDFWLKQNGCSTMTVPGNPMQCQVYQGCDPQNGVTWCPHNMDGGHQHPSFGRAAVREFLAAF